MPAIGDKFYFSTIRKSVVAFATIFNSIHLVEIDSVGTQVSDTEVPLSYLPRQAYIASLRDRVGSESFGILLPQMTFSMDGIEYDSLRQKNALYSKIAKTTADPTKIQRQLNPVPYNVNFTLSIFVKNTEDGLQIIEQILPFFAPTYNVTIDAISGMGITKDIPILLNSVDLDDNSEEQLQAGNNRYINWNLSFTAQVDVYSPIATTGIIKTTLTKLYEDDTMIQALESIGVNVTPPSAALGDAFTSPTVITSLEP